MPLDLNPLIQCLEKATGPDRELDNEIYTEVLRTQIIKPGQRPLTSDREYTPQYTASIDAALTLVPEGWRVYQLGQRADYWCASIFTVKPHLAPTTSWARVHAATPALALCIAALKAKQDDKWT